jgi:quercetin dioxygenase-like cupin family protein
MLKFEGQGTIDEHTAPYEIHVVCLEGEGYISIEDRIWAYRPGLSLAWAAGRLHRLWPQTPERVRKCQVAEVGRYRTYVPEAAAAGDRRKSGTG